MSEGQNRIVLRGANAHDIPAIQHIVGEVWPITYGHIISPEQISYMIDKMYSATSLDEQMNTGSEFIVALDKSEIIGFASYQEISQHVFKLHKLYLLSTEQGRGVGKLLLDEVCSIAKRLGGNRLELQVNKRNKARDFYLRNQFLVDSELILDIGNGFVMDDYIMSRAL